MSRDQQALQSLERVLTPWFDQWQPCELGEHDRTVTSQDLVGMVQRFLRTEFDEAMLVQLLQKKGFRHTVIGDDFRWLLKERQA